MADFASQRKTMVDNQIRTVDVTDHAVLDAFSTVGREAFVPAAMQSLAYLDRPVDLGGGRAMMQPATLAKLVQLAAPRIGEKVLIVGGTTGYTAAIFADLGTTVVMLEENPMLVAVAKSALAGDDRVTIAVGPLTAGWRAAAPYDLIVFDGAIETLPAAIAGQVAPGGRIVAVEGTGLSGQAVVSVESSGVLSSRTAFNLPGQLLPGFARAKAFAL